MTRMIRKNFLLPMEIVSRLKSLVRSGRYATESDVVRISLRQTIGLELKSASETLSELDRLAEQTAMYLPKDKTAGQLVHESHAEESEGV